VHVSSHSTSVPVALYIMFKALYEEPKNPIAVEKQVYDAPYSRNGEATAAVYQKHGNEHDERDMDRMGKLQQLRVRPFRPSSIVIIGC
jgi:hypothetical protein